MGFATVSQGGLLRRRIAASSPSVLSSKNPTFRRNTMKTNMLSKK